MFSFLKKKPINLDNKEAYELILCELIKILRDNSHIPQADWVRQIHGALLRNDEVDFVKKLNSVDMWGGSGAVWEVQPFISSDDEKQFGRNIIKLVEQMRISNIKYGRARSIADYFRRNN